MAASYFGGGSHRDVQVLGPNRVQDVERYSFYTIPSNIYGEYPIPYSLWTSGGWEGFVGDIASGVENLIADTPAIGASFLQDDDANGLLADYFDVVVEYVSPNPLADSYRGTVRIPLDGFLAAGDPFFARLGSSPAGLVQQEYDRLVAAAGL